jgi:hypothetical protein
LQWGTAVGSPELLKLQEALIIRLLGQCRQQPIQSVTNGFMLSVFLLFFSIMILSHWHFGLLSKLFKTSVIECHHTWFASLGLHWAPGWAKSSHVTVLSLKAKTFNDQQTQSLFNSV